MAYLLPPHVVKYDDFRWHIMDGPARDLVIAQIPDIYRIPLQDRPPLRLVYDRADEGSRGRNVFFLKLTGLRSVLWDDTRDSGDLWEVEGFLEGTDICENKCVFGFVRGLYDTRTRKGGLDYVGRGGAFRDFDGPEPEAETALVMQAIAQRLLVEQPDSTHFRYSAGPQQLADEVLAAVLERYDLVKRLPFDDKPF